MGAVWGVVCGEVRGNVCVLCGAVFGGVTRASGEMADALASGASDRKIVGVQVPPRPPLQKGTSPL